MMNSLRDEILEALYDTDGFRGLLHEQQADRILAIIDKHRGVQILSESMYLPPKP